MSPKQEMSPGPKSAKQDVARPVSEVPMKDEDGDCNQAATGTNREWVLPLLYYSTGMHALC